MINEHYFMYCTVPLFFFPTPGRRDLYISLCQLPVTIEARSTLASAVQVTGGNSCKALSLKGGAVESAAPTIAVSDCKIMWIAVRVHHVSVQCYGRHVRAKCSVKLTQQLLGIRLSLHQEGVRVDAAVKKLSPVAITGTHLRARTTAQVRPLTEEEKEVGEH